MSKQLSQNETFDVHSLLSNGCPTDYFHVYSPLQNVQLELVTNTTEKFASEEWVDAELGRCSEGDTDSTKFSQLSGELSIRYY